MKPPLVIFDLNGTLADVSHRQHMVAKGPDGKYLQKPDWPAYYAACVGDKPMPAAIAVAHALADSGFELWLFSGNGDEARDATAEWLSRQGILRLFTKFFFRTQSDFAPDHVRKIRWYDGLLPEDKGRLLLVFDDRDATVKAWRSRGVVCFQTAAGAF